MAFKSKIFLVLAGVLMVANLRAQEKVFTSTKNRNAYQIYIKSTDYMMAKKYGEAEKLLLKAVNADPEYVDAYMRLSTIYYKQKKVDKEKEMYDKVVEVRPQFPEVYFNLGHWMMRQLKYNEAITYFKKFLELKRGESKFIKTANLNIKICEFRSNSIEHPVPFKPINVGAGVNSDEDEYWPVLTADDNHLYFTRKLLVDSTIKIGYGQYNEDIFSSTLSGTTWGKAKPLPGFLNTKNRNEGAISISPDGNSLFFTICSDDPSFGYGWCDIYYSVKRGGVWQKPRNIGPPINTRMKETQPSISYDGKTLYFSSNRKGTLGKLDIWKSSLQPNGSWGEPVNLGQNINTKGNEQSPFIHADDQTLYFSTDQKIGMGESDLFIARKNSRGDFVMVTNLGYPINTEKSEIALFVSAGGKKAFFASKKDGGQGGLDIYYFNLPNKFRPRPVCYLKGVVYDADTKAKLGAKFELINLETGKIVMESTSDPKTGAFLVALPSVTDYAINVSKKGYLFYSENLPIKNVKSTAYEHDVPLVPLKVGKATVLRNVFFDTDKYNLKPESKAELRKVIQFMNQYPNIKIELSGHTDNKGTPQHNQELSKNRAKAVYNYLVNEGKIPASRLSFKGYGQTKPIDSNATETGRANNRRTELKVTSM